MIRFRLPTVEYELLERRAVEMNLPHSAAAREIVRSELLQVEVEKEAGPDEPRSAPLEPPPSEPLSEEENPLKRAARLRKEWEELEHDHPQLAREIGSFDEYARRVP